MTTDEKLDRLIAGHAKMEGTLDSIDARLDHHTSNDERNFAALHHEVKAAMQAVIRLETSAELHDKMAASAAKKANARWTVIAVFAAVISAGAAIAQVVM